MLAAGIVDSKAPSGGKSSLWGAPYAGNPIDYDAVELRALSEEAPAK